MSIREWLDSREFYEACYHYRTIPYGSHPDKVIAAFENLKDVIENKFVEFTSSSE